MSLPTGVVTFVFSDIEGSTAHWETDPTGMEVSLARHDGIVREAIETFGGHLFKHTGDGFGAAFESPTAGLATAAAVASAIDAEVWPGPTLTCRIGVHAGEAAPRDGDYFGPTVTRTARLTDAGNGGQIIVSDALHRLVGGRAPEGLLFVSAGEHRLKDLGEPIGIHRLVGEGASDERRLRTLEAAPHNLPVQLSTFIGRESQIKEISQLLLRSRIVTLTGIGGVGKTRLSLQVAAEVLAEFPDGAWFSELAPLSEPGIIPDAVASALGVPVDSTVPAMERILAHMATRRALLVLDNCEHLIDDVAAATEKILRGCPELAVLATSREGLGVPGEALWRVPSLRVDEDEAALHLFAERARLVRPEFAVTDENRAVVSRLCDRLDGIPLAIELATARLKMLSVDQIAEHLDDRFRLLTGGSRTAVERQRTLRAMMDWSHDLLAEAERVLLRRLSVFSDGFTYEGAVRVGEGEGVDAFEVLDLLGHLVEASLVVFDEEHGRPRYRLLETVRQYALDQLFDAGEADEARRRHAEYFRDFAAGYDERILADKDDALTGGDLELGNVRSALTWAIEAREGVLAVELASGFRNHFWYRVMYDESVRWSLQALELVDDDASPRVVRAVANALTDAVNMNDVVSIDRLGPRARRLYEAAALPEDRGELANSLATVAMVTDLLEADRLQVQALEELRAAGSDRWVAPLQNRVVTAMFMYDGASEQEVMPMAEQAVTEGLGGSLHLRAVRLAYAALRGDHEEVLAETTDADPADDWERFWLSLLHSTSARTLGRPDEARAALARAIVGLGRWGKLFTAWHDAMLALAEDDVAGVVPAIQIQLGAFVPRNRVSACDIATLTMITAQIRGRWEDAARLAGFARAAQAETHQNWPPVDVARIERARAIIEDQLGAARYEALLAEGASMSWDHLPTLDAILS
jgi:predicted ATPase/class 3 adenylate cyclase